MKENYQIYLPYQFHRRAHSVGQDPQLSHEKMKTLFLSNMSKSRRLTLTFFPIKSSWFSKRRYGLTPQPMDGWNLERDTTFTFIAFERLKSLQCQKIWKFSWANLFFIDFKQLLLDTILEIKMFLNIKKLVTKLKLHIFEQAAQTTSL